MDFDEFASIPYRAESWSLRIYSSRCRTFRVQGLGFSGLQGSGFRVGRSLACLRKGLGSSFVVKGSGLRVCMAIDSEFKVQTIFFVVTLNSKP